MDNLSTTSFLAFILTSLTLNLSPGPAVMQVIGHSLNGGPKQSQASIFGIMLANSCYCALSVLGLGALLLSTPGALLPIQLVGAGYLGYLGLNSLRGSAKGAELLREALAPGRMLRQSFLRQLANPKSILFFGAFLPAFVSGSAQAPWLLAKLGALAVCCEYPVLLGYAFLARRLGAMLAEAWCQRLFGLVSGAVLLAAALSVVGFRLPQ